MTLIKNSTNVNNTTKSIIIEGDVHKDYRDYCRGKGLKIGNLTQDLINLYLNDPKSIQKLIDELKDKREKA